MFIRLLALFTAVPLLELYILIKAGAIIGAGPTIALVILTGVGGAYLARTQGLDTLRRIQEQLARGRMPADELFDGAMIMAGGLLLLTPGLATDLLGFCLLVPFTRRVFKGGLKKWFERHFILIERR